MLPANGTNKILQLFDEEFVLELFNRQVLPLYPGFQKIQSVKINPIKKNVWETTYHVVTEYLTTFLKTDGQTLELPIYCSAHSNEPRNNSFMALNFLWRQGFNHGQLTIPRPLFFSDYFNGYFYRGVQGKNLYHYIRHEELETAEKILPKAAAWFAKLHGLPTDRAENFNQQNSRIETVIPGFNFIFTKLENNYPDHYAIYRQTFEFISEREKKFLSGTQKFYLIHGDAHPENVIKMSGQTTAVIDFTDICLADFARDLGAFMQQLEFMSLRKVSDKNRIKKMQDIFLQSYLELAGIKLDDSLKERINYYYAWTSLRTATLFLLKEPAEPKRAHALLDKARRDLRLN